MSIPFDKVLEILQADQDAAPRPPLGSQRTDLLERFARYEQRTIFEPGSLVREKAGLARLQAKFRATHVLLFVRYLDVVSSWLDRDLVERHRETYPKTECDCVVWAIPDVAEGAPDAWLYDSRTLELDPEADVQGAPE